MDAENVEAASEIPINTTEINVRYINEANDGICNLLLTHRILCLRSVCDTGKTHWVSEYMDAHPEQNVLIISQRRPLHNLQKKLKCVQYDELPEQFSQPTRVVVPWALLYMVKRFSFDLVVLDESQRVCNNCFCSDTNGHHMIENMQLFRAIINNAKTVLAVDANIGPKTFELLRSTGALLTDIVLVDNIYRHKERWVMTYRFENKKAKARPIYCTYFNELMAAVKRGHGVMVTSARETFLNKHAIPLLMCAGVKRSNMLCYTEDIFSRNNLSELNNINDRLLELDGSGEPFALVMNPTIAVGVDITANVFSGIFCYISRNAIEAEMTVQQIMRVRNPVESVIYLAHYMVNCKNVHVPSVNEHMQETRDHRLIMKDLVERGVINCRLDFTEGPTDDVNINTTTAIMDAPLLRFFATVEISKLQSQKDCLREFTRIVKPWNWKIEKFKLRPHQRAL